MMPATVPYRDALTLIIAGLSISLTIFFGHFKTWRHRICFEYDGKQAAAVTALRDKFQEEAEQHYRAIQDHVQRTGETVQQFYAEGKQRTLVKALALKLERSNQIIRACSHYLRASTMSAKLRKPMKSTSSFSNLEKILRKPLSLRNNRSISLRFL